MDHGSVVRLRRSHLYLRGGSGYPDSSVGRNSATVKMTQAAMREVNTSTARVFHADDADNSFWLSIESISAIPDGTDAKDVSEPSARNCAMTESDFRSPGRKGTNASQRKPKATANNQGLVLSTDISVKMLQYATAPTGI